jgi:uncharacterized phage-associated protein
MIAMLRSIVSGTAAPHRWPWVRRLRDRFQGKNEPRKNEPGGTYQCSHGRHRPTLVASAGALGSNQPVRYANSMASSLDIAAEIQDIAETHSGDALSPGQLQKVMFYAHALSLALDGEPLFAEPFEAWTHGPVEPASWAEGKSDPSFSRRRTRRSQMPDAMRHRLRGAVIVFGGLSTIELSNATHAERPWIDAREGLRPDAASTRTLDTTLIRDWYGHLIEEGSDAMADLGLSPPEGEESWLPAYRTAVNLRRLSGHPFFDEARSRDLRRQLGHDAVPADWSAVLEAAKPLTAGERADVVRFGRT